MFILPSKEEACWFEEQPLAGSKSLQTREVCHKALKEEYAAQAKEKSLLGHLLSSEVLPEKFLESDIFLYSRN